MSLIRVLGIAQKTAVLTIAAGVAAVVVSASAANATDAAPAVSGAISVSPSTNLSDGQSVSVTGTGFPAGAQIGAVECSNGTWPDVSCDVAHATNITANAQGGFSSALTVDASFDGIDPATGQPAGSVDCTVAPGCSVRVGSADSTIFADPVTITFAG